LNYILDLTTTFQLRTKLIQFISTFLIINRNFCLDIITVVSSSCRHHDGEIPNSTRKLSLDKTRKLCNL
jgi:hypothetical protein